jgi:acyl-CoA synthetase (AMP-forming)/AMP-acid ligase II
VGGWLGALGHDPSRPAVHLADDGRLLTLSRADLAARVARAADTLAGERRLVQVAAASRLGTLVTYLAAHAAGHVVLLTPPPGPAADAIAATWDPDVVVAPDGSVEVLRTGTRHDLHPDLALLMSTSGSTGSPRLVRLSRDNLRSNAEAIAEFLAIRPDDRAVTSLPLHYCYGLSVVHSHLVAGASVVLTDLSVADRCFWELARGAEVTTLAGVPHSFELLERVGFAGMDLPRLRTVTQAGGRLDPQRVLSFAELGRRRGWDLVVMYGQTEATARMTWLPPELAAGSPGTVGVPIPGGLVDLVDGEIVYSGPNVMLGYADSPADLALGRTLDRLHTGDLGRWTDAGLLEVTGRRSRVAKVLGHRVDLDHVESSLRADGCDVRCVDGGAGLVVCAAGVPGADLVGATARRAGLPARCIRVVGPRDLGLTELPHLPSGKVDYAALTGLVGASGADPPGARGGAGAVATSGREVGSGSAQPSGPAPVSESLGERYAVLLGVDAVAPEDSFTSLGGDSLSYVEVSLHVEEHLGHLPADWHLLSIRDLEARAAAPAAAAGGAPASARSSWFGGRVPTRTVETSVVLRAVAILLIVGTHAHAFTLQGTAHALLVLVGWNLARFRLTEAPRAERVRGLLTAVRRVAAPALVVLAGAHLLAGQYSLHTVGLVNWVFGEERLGPDWRFWFIEAAVLVLLVVTAIVATPWGDALERRAPLLLPLGLAGLGMLSWQGLVHPPVPHMQGSALVVSWLFCLGWAAAKARGQRQRLLVTLVAVPTVGTFSGNPRRDLLTLAAVLLVLWVPTTRVPRQVVPALHVFAASSLYVYVAHWQVVPALRGTPWLAFAAGLAVGVAYWWAWTRTTALVHGIRSRTSPTSSVRLRAARGLVRRVAAR